MQQVINIIYAYLATYGFKIIAALVIFIVGRWVARFVSKLVKKAMIKANVDETLAGFTQNLCYIALLAFVIIAALEKLGVRMTSFVVIVGAAGLAVGFALQGSLANFAAGVMLIIFKPFKAGDFVEAGGKAGTVEKIQIFNTILKSPDNVRIIIPNGQVTSSNIMNYTVNGTRRIDLVVGVSYEDDLKKAQQVIEKIILSDERILKEPVYTVAVSELGDSSVNFVVRPWVNASDYWAVRFDLTEKIKLALDKNGITIPYPQRDIHMKSGAA